MILKEFNFQVITSTLLFNNKVNVNLTINDCLIQLELIYFNNQIIILYSGEIITNINFEYYVINNSFKFNTIKHNKTILKFVEYLTENYKYNKKSFKLEEIIL